MAKIVLFGNKYIKKAAEQLESTANQIALKTNNGGNLTDADLDAFFGNAAELLEAKRNHKNKTTT